jgi:DNA-binding GntR family transcriptional regulator
VRGVLCDIIAIVEPRCFRGACILMSDVSAPPEFADAAAGDPAEWAPHLLKSKVYEQLLLDIILGELAPSAALEEKRLVLRYQAGLAGVREALGRLALEGLVVRRARLGTIVAPLDLREIEQAFEVRHMIEGRSAWLAAKNAKPADIAQILHAFDDAETAIASGDFRGLLAMDRQFHRSVAYATQNPMLARYIVTLQNIATRFWIYAMEKESPDEQRADVANHREVAEAIAARDPQRAERAMAKLVGEPPSAYGR